MVRGFRPRAALALALGLIVSPSAAQTPTDLTAQAKTLLAKPPSPEAVFRLRQEMGESRFGALRTAIGALIVPSGLKPGEQIAGCVVDPAGSRLNGLLTLALATKDEAEWRARMSEADAALARLEALRQAVVDRGEPRQGFETAVDAARRALAEPDPWRRELAVRESRDQFWRLREVAMQQPGGWAEGVSAPVLTYLNFRLYGDDCASDLDNQAWLKAELAKRGWPRISRDGKEADGAAFIIVQHADNDPAWQAEILKVLGELTPLGETGSARYAYLFDRIAYKRRDPERYGTQGHCVAAGQWRSYPVEPGDLDARRKSVGLAAEAVYEARMAGYCKRADAG